VLRVGAVGGCRARRQAGLGVAARDREGGAAEPGGAVGCGPFVHEGCGGWVWFWGGGARLARARGGDVIPLVARGGWWGRLFGAGMGGGVCGEFVGAPATARGGWGSAGSALGGRGAGFGPRGVSSSVGTGVLGLGGRERMGVG